MKASQVSQTEISVLITGESGTGKDIIPKIIHTKSENMGHLSLLIVAQFQKEQWIVNYLVMKRVLLLVLLTKRKDILKKLTKEQFF